MGHYDCKYCDASPGEEHSADCERFQPMTNPNHTDTSRSGDLVKMLADAVFTGTGVMKDGKHVPIEDVYLDPRDARIEALEAENERLREELAAAYIKLSGTDQHASDCATSNAPAMKPGPCDCKENAETFARSGDV